MKITWYGNASILLEAAGEKIFFDPFVELKGGQHPLPPSEYAVAPHICITHGHLDHLASLPEILEVYASLPTVYGTRQTGINLLNRTSRCALKVISPNESFSIGDVKITAFQGRHVRFDKKLVLKTALSPRIFKHFSNLLYIGKALKEYPENKETLVYLVEADGKSVLIMGSLGLDKNTVYPTGMDAFICPFQGHSKIDEKAEEVIERLRPKRVILDHFDDAFPPLSNTIDAEEFAKKFTFEKGIEAIAPEFLKSITI